MFYSYLTKEISKACGSMDYSYITNPQPLHWSHLSLTYTVALYHINFYLDKVAAI